MSALEASVHKTVLIAAYGSAIPEVLESAPYYINPYSKNSICQALCYISNDKNRELIKRKIQEYQSVVSLRIEKSDSNFLKEFIH